MGPHDGGYGADRPPADPDALDAYTASVAPPDVLDEVRASEQLGEIRTYRFPFGVRRRYDRLRPVPGLVVAGDAICSFNPIYGQGMSVAAAEALALQGCAADGRRGLERRYVRAVAPIVADAWRLTTGSDLALPCVPGRRPLPVRASNAYVARVRAVAARDLEVSAAFAAVIGLRERPSHIFRPTVLRRVARGARPRVPAAASPRPALG